MVLELIADGKRNKEIADALGITQETVQTHVKHLFVKLNVTDRTAAVKAGMSRGILHIW
jgi:DNA-binding NarL/FixJ family response regulator